MSHEGTLIFLKSIFNNNNDNNNTFYLEAPFKTFKDTLQFKQDKHKNWK